MSRQRSATQLRAAVVILVALLGGACSAGEDGPGLMPALAARHDAGGHGYPYQNLAELLPNHVYRIGEQPATPMAQAVVTGRFSALTEGYGFAVEGTDAPAGTRVDFDSSEALWRTMHATFRVDKVISGADPGKEITVGLSFDAKTPMAPIEKDLLALGDVMLFLTRTPVFGYDPTIYGVVLDGALIAPLDDSGRLSLPALEQAEADKLLKGSATVDQLITEARKPTRMIQLDPTGTQRLAG